MSCGNHHETDCSDVLDLVDEFLDNEIDWDRRAQIAVHLDECSPCLKQYGLEQAVKQLVNRACGCGPAPEHLRVEIVTRLRQISITYRTYGD